MQDETPASEIAARLLGELDDKHHQDLDDLLKGQFGLRAKELKANMLALAEEEAQARAVVGKNFKARKQAVDEVHKKLGDKVDTEKLKAQLMKDLERLKADENKEMKEL